MTEKQSSVTRRKVLQASGATIVAGGAFASGATASEHQNPQISATLSEDCTTVTFTLEDRAGYGGSIQLTANGNTGSFQGQGADPEGSTEEVTVNLEPGETAELSASPGTVNPSTVTCPEEDPETIQDCQEDYQRYGFRNQGQCNRFVNTGEDSR